MLMVILACMPAMAVQWYYFGWGNLIHLGIAALTAIGAEAAILKLRNRPILPTIKDYSALLTAVLLAMSIPSVTPWWVTVSGTLFAIIIVKQLYGGLGFNLFNPAMAGYVMLLVAWPVQMTSWLPPAELASHQAGLSQTASLIFLETDASGNTVEHYRQSITNGVDAVTLATPLDTLKTELLQGYTATEVFNNPVFGDHAGIGWQTLNLAFLLGGLILLFTNTIRWHIPVGLLGGLTIASLIGFMISPDGCGSPVFHLLSGATMMGAFFIATDPVSASTTNKGRLYYGAMIGVLVYLIRQFGGYPDAMAFSVLLANMCVPLIDYYTRPRTYGHADKEQEQG